MVGILHQTDEQLELYALGRLPEPWIAEVEEHLLVCAACQERVDDLEAYAFAMRQAISTEPAEPVRWFHQSWLKMPVFAWAGGLALVLLAGVLYLPFAPHVAPLASLQLTSMRGTMPSVAPSRETDITLVDAPSGITLRAEIVNSSGGVLWKRALGNFPIDSSPRIALRRQLAPGSYFVRLFDESGKLLHEYGFQVRASL